VYFITIAKAPCQAFEAIFFSTRKVFLAGFSFRAQPAFRGECRRKYAENFGMEPEESGAPRSATHQLSE
jgi:hypothetical protein